MAEHAVILTPGEFDRLVIQVRDQISKEISSLKSLVVEKPLTTKGAAEFLSLNEKVLLRKIVAGSDIPFHREGKMYYFFPSELSDYVKSKNKRK